MGELILLIILIGTIVFIFSRSSNKKKRKEETRGALLNDYSRYKDLIENFDKSYQSLKVAPVEKVNYTLQIVNPKYELMLPLVKYKDQVSDWFAVIKDLKLLENIVIRNNVKVVLKRFSLIECYGEDIGSRLAVKGTFEGMSEQMLVDSRGEPKNVTREGAIESKTVYSYQNKSTEEVFTFINGKLVSSFIC